MQTDRPCVLLFNLFLLLVVVLAFPTYFTAMMEFSKKLRQVDTICSELHVSAEDLRTITNSESLINLKKKKKKRWTDR